MLDEVIFTEDAFPVLRENLETGPKGQVLRANQSGRGRQQNSLQCFRLMTRADPVPWPFSFQEPDGIMIFLLNEH